VFLSNLFASFIGAAVSGLGQVAEIMASVFAGQFSRAKDLTAAMLEDMFMEGGKFDPFSKPAEAITTAFRAMETFQKGTRSIARATAGQTRTGGGATTAATAAAAVAAGGPSDGITDAMIDAISFKTGEEVLGGMPLFETDELESMLQELVDDEWARHDEVLANQERTFDALGALISGDIGGMLSSFQEEIGGAVLKIAPGLQGRMEARAGGAIAGAAGLVGGGVVQGAQLLAQLGETGADAVADQAEAFLEAIVAGLKELPKLLTDFLPELVGTLIPELLMGIHESLPDIIWGVLKAAVLLIKATLFDLPKALILGFAELFSDWWGKIRDFFQNVFSFGGVDDQQFQAGTGHVDRTGMALVHQGESIIPRGGVAGQTTAAGMGGASAAPAVTINTNVVDPNSIPALVSEIERHFGSYGRGTSPLFSGA